MKSTVFGRFTKRDEVPEIKELHIVRDRQFRLRRDKSGVEDIVNLDLRFAHLGRHWHGRVGVSEWVDSFGSVRVFDDSVQVKVTGSVSGDDVPPNIDLEDYTGPYPKLIYLAEGETETPEAQLFSNPGTVPTWIRQDTPENVAARYKAWQVSQWRTKLSQAARKYASENRSQDWAHEHGHGHQAHPQVCLDLDKDNPQHTMYIDAADFISVHLPKWIGIAWRVVSLYDDPDNVTLYDIGDAGDDQWKVRTQYNQGDYKKHDGVTFICKRDHNSGQALGPVRAGDRNWQPQVLGGVPTSVNLTTGDGIDELVNLAVSQLDEDVHFLWHAMLHKHSEWKPNYDAYKVAKVNITSRDHDDEAASPGDVVYTSEVLTAFDTSDTAQVKHAAGYAPADWVDLFRRQFQLARTYKESE